MAKKKQQNSLNKVLSVLAVLAALIIAAYSGISIWQKTIDFRKWNFKPAEAQEQPNDSGFIAPNESKSDVIKFSSKAIPIAQYDEYGVSAAAETAVTLIVTPTPAEIDLEGGTFTYKFKNAGSEWATGKTLSDYVTLNQTDSTHATVECLKDFGEQIIVTYTFETVTADYPLDYAKRIKDIGIPQLHMVGQPAFSVTDKANFTFKMLTAQNAYIQFDEHIEYSDYTIDETFSLGSRAGFEIKKEVKQALKERFSLSVGLDRFPAGTMTMGKVTFTSRGASNMLMHFFGDWYQKQELRDIIEEYNAEGIFTFTIHLVGEHSATVKTFTYGIDLTNFPTLLQDVKFQDDGHIF